MKCMGGPSSEDPMLSAALVIECIWCLKNMLLFDNTNSCRFLDFCELLSHTLQCQLPYIRCCKIKHVYIITKWPMWQLQNFIGSKGQTYPICNFKMLQKYRNLQDYTYLVSGIYNYVWIHIATDRHANSFLWGCFGSCHDGLFDQNKTTCWTGKTMDYFRLQQLSMVNQKISYCTMKCYKLSCSVLMVKSETKTNNQCMAYINVTCIYLDSSTNTLYINHVPICQIIYIENYEENNVKFMHQSGTAQN